MTIRRFHVIVLVLINAFAGPHLYASQSCSVGLFSATADRYGRLSSYVMNFQSQSGQHHFNVTFSFPDHYAQKGTAHFQLLSVSSLETQEKQLVANLMRSILKKYQVTEISGNAFTRWSARNLSRGEYMDVTNQFVESAQILYGQSSTIFPSLTVLRRTRSSAIAEAADKMANLLVRRKFISDAKVAYRIVNEAHRLLVSELSNQERRYFDYALFDEVLPYSLSEKFQSIADFESRLTGVQVNVESLHDKIRNRFLQLSETLLRTRAQQLLVPQERMRHLLGKLKLTLANIEKMGVQSDNFNIAEYFLRAYLEPDQILHPVAMSLLKDLLARSRSLDEDPESSNYFNELKTYLSNFDLPELFYPQHTKGLEVQEDQLEDLTFNLRTLVFEIQKHLEYVLALSEHSGSNEAHFITEVRPEYLNLRFSITTVQASNGGNEGSNFMDLGAGTPTSFIYHPRRMSSGNGNRELRLEE